MPTANSMSGRPTRLLVSTSISRESSCTRDHSSFDLNFSDLFPKCRAREKVQRKEKLQWLRRWRRLHLSIQKSSFRQKCGRWGMSKYIISIWNVNKDGVTQFIEQANNHHPTIKFMAEISATEITFLDTNVFKGERFTSESILDVKTHFKPTETFQYTHFSSCHPPGVKKGLIKGEALRLLRTNSSKTQFKA